MNSAELFVKALENEGVKYVFGVPGEENLDVIDALRDSTIKLVVTRHEQTAGFMAATYGRLTGEVGVCLSTLGPGATNLITAAAYANLGAMPMLMITGQKPIRRSKQGKFQIINVVEVMQPVTKAAKCIVEGNAIPAIVRDFFRIARTERPGAVHLELPEDVAAETVENTTLFEVYRPSRPCPDQSAVIKAIDMIQQAKKPLLLLGAGANRQSATDPLTRFIKKTKMPFCTTQMGKGVIDERDPLYMGCAAISSGDYIHWAIHYADVIINVGHDVVEKPPFIMSHEHQRKVIHINYFPANIDEIYFPELEVIGDVAKSMEAITDGIQSQSHWDFSGFSRLQKSYRDDIEKTLQQDHDHFPFLPQFLVSETRCIMPENGVLTLDNGLYKIWYARNYLAYHSNSILLDNALATMGAGLPSAMGTAIVCPERPVVAVCGDGGFMMNLQDLETAVRLQLNLTILLLLDNAYGMIKWKQANMGLADFGLDFGNPDFVKLAADFGARGHRVTKPTEFAEMLAKTIKQPGVDLIEVPIDYQESVADLGVNLKNKIAKLK